MCLFFDYTKLTLFSPRFLHSQQNNESSREETLSSLPQASFNYINSIVGSGVIGIPYALHRAGFGLGLFLLVIVAVITDYSLILMVSESSLNTRDLNYALVEATEVVRSIHCGHGIFKTKILVITFLIILEGKTQTSI